MSQLSKKENFALASRILGRKVALLALGRMAKKLKFFSREYKSFDKYADLRIFYEDQKKTSMSVLGHATKWTTCPRKYKAHQKALHALRACLNSPEYWAVKGGV